MSESTHAFGFRIVGTAVNGKAPLLEPDKNVLAQMAIIRKAYELIIKQMKEGKKFTKNPIRRGETLYFTVENYFFAVGPESMGRCKESVIPDDAEPQGEMTYGGICDIAAYSDTLAKYIAAHEAR